MAQVHRHVLRFDRGCDRVQHVAALGERDEVLEVGERPGPAAALQVGDVRRAGHRQQRQAPATDPCGVGLVACVDLERRWRRRDCPANQVGIEANHARLVVHHGAGLAEQPPCLGQQHADARRLQVGQCRLVDVGDLVLAEHRRGRERVLQVAVRGLRTNCAPRPRRASPAPFGLLSGHHVLPRAHHASPLAQGTRL
jgi:hypothetical protein